MRTIAVILTISLLAMQVACMPPPTPPINSLAFQRRPPLPGQPGYLETIKYIDDGVHYISPIAGFFVSNTGDMCFQGAIIPGATPEYIPSNYWCMSPSAVGRVDAHRKRHQLHQPGSPVVPTRRAAMRLQDRLPEHARQSVDRQQHHHRDRTFPSATRRGRVPRLFDGRECCIATRRCNKAIGHGALDRPRPASSVRSLTLATEEIR